MCEECLKNLDGDKCGNYGLKMTGPVGALITGAWNMYQYNNGGTYVDFKAAMCDIVGSSISIILLTAMCGTEFCGCSCDDNMWVHLFAIVPLIVTIAGGSIDAWKYNNGHADVDMMQAILVISSSVVSVLVHAYRALRSGCGLKEDKSGHAAL
ncbi:MAG: hypothetical protein LBB38_01355 [Puniceicoccales bacterium]|jgi:hypothetical protein|nr:hypothetical protein [Puniceicoccales bacterium]